MFLMIILISMEQKNLLKELPAIPNETAEPEINQMQNYTENPTDNPEYSLNP